MTLMHALGILYAVVFINRLSLLSMLQNLKLYPHIQAGNTLHAGEN